MYTSSGLRQAEGFIRCALTGMRLSLVCGIGLLLAAPSALASDNTPPPRLVAGLPSCSAADLAVSNDDENGAFDATMHSGTRLTVRNEGRRACRLARWPRLEFLDAGQRPVAVAFERVVRQAINAPEQPLGLAPGESATSVLRWVSGDAYGDGNCHPTTQLRVRIKARAVSTPLDARLCSPAKQPAQIERSPLRTGP
tara:strand:+ start:7753 stop:8343 length:591 start_codon:yes stop_codon:yes gene_type:complete